MHHYQWNTTKVENGMMVIHFSQLQYLKSLLSYSMLTCPGYPCINMGKIPRHHISSSLKPYPSSFINGRSSILFFNSNYIMKSFAVLLLVPFINARCLDTGQNAFLQHDTLRTISDGQNQLLLKDRIHDFAQQPTVLSNLAKTLSRKGPVPLSNLCPVWDEKEFTTTTWTGHKALWRIRCKKAVTGHLYKDKICDGGSVYQILRQRQENDDYRGLYFDVNGICQEVIPNGNSGWAGYDVVDSDMNHVFIERKHDDEWPPV